MGELIEIGAAWSRQGNSGEFLSVKIGGKSAMMFRNTKKLEGSKQPDWRIVSDDAELTAQFGTDFKPREAVEVKPAQEAAGRPAFANGSADNIDETPF